MSLLLEALKKAELAKHSQTKAEPEPAAQPSGLALEAEPERAEPVLTRGELPDITQPLQILSEDLPSARLEVESDRPAAPSAAGNTGATRATAEVAPANDLAPPTASDDSREAARQLFEAMEVNYNPRRPFYITVGVLGLAAAGYAGYVWWQMQPHYSYSPTAVKDAPRAAQPAQTAAPAPAAANGPQATAAAPPPAPATPREVKPEVKAAASALPTTGGAESASPSGIVLRRGSAAGATERRSSERVQQTAPRSRTPANLPIAVNPPATRTDATLVRAWESYQNGDFGAARKSYEQMLAREADNRDALLGLAALDVHARNYSGAEARYQRLLELDPRDSFAQAGLIGLRGQSDPVQSESRLKLLISAQPEASQLHFALGNQYAQQRRWPEAQQAYFRAYSADAENADYAFNLAVSLDQLRQKKAALEYYQRSLALALRQPANFDRGLAEARIQELRQQ